MKNRIIALVVGMVLLVSSSLAAQAPDTLWTRTYGNVSNDYGYCVSATADSGFIIVGSTNNGSDFYLVKIDGYGSLLWTKQYDFGGNDEARAVRQTIDGGYIVAGRKLGNEPHIIRTDSLGNIEWQITIPDSSDEGCAYEVLEIGDSSYIVTGNRDWAGSGGDQAFLTKLTMTGNISWVRDYGGNGYNAGYDVIQTLDGNYAIVGCYAYGAQSYVYLVKVGTTGGVYWERTYPGVPSWMTGRSMQQTTDEGFIIAGYKEGSASVGDYNIIVLRTDSLGDSLWMRIYGDTAYFDQGREMAYSIETTSDGGFIIAGEADLDTSWWINSDMYVVRADGYGNTLWSRTYGGSNRDVAHSICETDDAGYIIVGSTSSFGAGGWDIYAVRLDTDPCAYKFNEDKSPKASIHHATITASPNPFSDKTTLEFEIGKNQIACLKIVDICGRIVKQFSKPASKYPHPCKISWDGRDSSGHPLPKGIYFAIINSGSSQIKKKLTLIR